jgi:hypothetical protein
VWWDVFSTSSIGRFADFSAYYCIAYQFCLESSGNFLDYHFFHFGNRHHDNYHYRKQLQLRSANCHLWPGQALC